MEETWELAVVSTSTSEGTKTPIHTKNGSVWAENLPSEAVDLDGLQRPVIHQFAYSKPASSGLFLVAAILGAMLAITFGTLALLGLI